MLRHLKNHGLLALVFFVLTLAQQYVFLAMMKFPIIWLTFSKLCSVYILLLVLTFAKNKWIRFSLLSFILFFNFFQMAHLSYYGTQILPVEFLLAVTQWHEVAGVLKSEFHHILVPMIFTVVPLALGGWFNLRNKSYAGTHVVTILFVLYFAYNPIRTYLTGNTWGRQPSNRELTGMNVYLSLSYFMGKILPEKIASKKYSLNENESLRLKLTQDKTTWDDVIVVLGESLTPNHMQLFGYSEPTTPFLKSLENDMRFYFTRVISSGVSSDITIAFFMNLSYGDAGAIKAAKGEHCLFRMAKKNGYRTSFYSAQSGQQLRYISPYLCSAFLDEFKGLEEIAPETEDEQAASDRTLLPHLEKLLSTPEKKFIMLHQRGSHAPWHLRYSKEAAVMKKSKDKRINHYDNSVVEFDLFWKELNQIIKKSPRKILVVYLSDHGEALGEDGKWGHGHMHPPSFEVPLLIQSFNQELPGGTRNLPTNSTQYNVGLYLLNQLGWKTNQAATSIAQDFVIYGNDIDGFAGKAAVKFGPTGNYRIEIIP